MSDTGVSVNLADVPMSLDALRELATPEQQRAVDFAVAGNNLFLSGPGGTGKTFTIHQLVRQLERLGKRVAITAMTGCAAVLLGNLGDDTRPEPAITLHSFSGMPVRDDWNPVLTARHIKSRKKNVQTRWCSTDVLIIDEVSMLQGRDLDKLGALACEIRKFVPSKNPGSDAFGGMQVIFVGDFLQLPPVRSPGEAEHDFCFLTETWGRLLPSAPQQHVLTIAKRQTGNAQWAEILNRVRVGIVDEEVDAWMSSRVNKPLPASITELGIEPTKVFSTNSEVARINNDRYDGLDSTTERTQTVSTVQHQKSGKVVVNDDEGAAGPDVKVIRNINISDIEMRDPNIVKRADLSMRYEPVLRLRVGAQVMFTANVDVKSGISNGTRGVVRGFMGDTPIVVTTTGKTVFAEPFAFPTDHPRVFRQQVPLRHAWAITVHKSQGQTIDLAEMDIGRTMFEYGQVYVALSRVRALDSLQLTTWDPTRVKAHPIVVDFYKTITGGH